MSVIAMLQNHPFFHVTIVFHVRMLFHMRISIGGHVYSVGPM